MLKLMLLTREEEEAGHGEKVGNVGRRRIELFNSSITIYE